MAQARNPVHNLSSLLDVLQHKIDADNHGSATKALSIEDVLRLIGRRAYGPLLLIIGLISISPAALLPGSTWALALLTLLIAGQLMLHRERPWMPKSALRIKLSEKALEGFIQRARPAARAVDKIIQPRLTLLSDPPAVTVVAFFCIIAALITFPLGLIPMAPFVPGLAIVFFGLGLTARDGALLLIGFIAISAGFAVLIWRLM